ncbi:hypothetical protein [Coxiella-like endosymbiont]|nr:hypothetical protein [Coxiella-like endosymbiont]
MIAASGFPVHHQVVHEIDELPRRPFEPVIGACSAWLGISVIDSA